MMKLFAGQCLYSRIRSGQTGDEEDLFEQISEVALQILNDRAGLDKLVQCLALLVVKKMLLKDLLDKLIPTNNQIWWRVLGQVPEESERAASMTDSDHRYKWSHQMASSYQTIVNVISAGPLDQVKLLVLKAWIGAGLPINMVTDLINQAIGLLQVYKEEVLELLICLAGLHGLDLVQSLSLIPIILKIDPSEGEDEAQLYVTFCETHSDDIFEAAIKKQDSLALEFLKHFLLKVTASQSLHVSSNSFNAWYLIHELAIEEGLPAGPLISSLFTNLTSVLLEKSIQSEDHEDEDEEWVQYRRDLGDCLLCCWRILNKEIYPLLLDNLTVNCPASFIESRLFAYSAISEEIEESHPLLETFISHLPSLVTNSKKNQCHAIKLFGCFAHIVIPPGTIQLLLGQLGGETSLECARAFYKIAEESPTSFTSEDRHNMISYLSNLQDEQAVMVLCKVFGMLSGTVSDEFDAAIRCLLTVNNLDFLTSLLKSAIGSPLALTSTILSLFDLCVHNILQKSDHLEKVYILADTLVIATQQVPTSLVDAIRVAASRAPTEHLIALCTTIICVQPSLTSAMIASLPTLDQLSEEDLQEAYLLMLAKTCCKGLIELDVLHSSLQWTVNRLAGSGISTPLLRSIVKLHSSLLALPQSEASTAIESIYASSIGQQLVQACLWSASSHLTTSQVGLAGRLLFELLSRFRSPTAFWLNQCMAQPDFPQPGHKFPPGAKEAFVKAFSSCKSVGRAKQLLTDFVAKQYNT